MDSRQEHPPPVHIISFKHTRAVVDIFDVLGIVLVIEACDVHVYVGVGTRAGATHTCEVSGVGMIAGDARATWNAVAGCLFPFQCCYS